MTRSTTLPESEALCDMAEEALLRQENNRMLLNRAKQERAKRDRAIIHLLGMGWSLQRIGDLLGMSKNHVHVLRREYLEDPEVDEL